MKMATAIDEIHSSERVMLCSDQTRRKLFAPRYRFQSQLNAVSRKPVGVHTERHDVHAADFWTLMITVITHVCLWTPWAER